MRYRIAFLMCVFFFIFTALAGRLAWEQVVNGPRLARAAVDMRSKAIELREVPRGDILDRNLLPLTDLSRCYALFALPRVIQNTYGGGGQEREVAFRQVANQLGQYLSQLEPEGIFQLLINADNQDHSLVRLAANLQDQEIDAIRNSGLQGVVIAPMVQRYRQDGFLAHLMGYVGMEDGNPGQAGLEKTYDSILSRSSGEQELVSVVDARGMIIRGLMFKLRQDQSAPSGTVVLTIDKRIQEIVETAMNRSISRGAVVVMDVQTREVLAMSSRPTFNPYDNIGQIIAQDAQSTLINRATSRYHPGSLFKILVAAAALEEGVVSETDIYDCTGKYVFNPQVSISCLKKDGHGPIDFTTAFVRSCNPAFVDIGQKLGRDRLLRYAQAFHLTDETLTGYIDDYNYSYISLEPGAPALGNASVGQKGVMITPLQITSLIACIADDGQWQAPSVVRYTIDQNGSRHPSGRSPKESAIGPDTARRVQDLMAKVVLDGSGQAAALNEVSIAGKTGTSQTGMIENHDGVPKEILNVWFGGYFPAQDPRWAIVVLVENGETGGKNAAPVFREIASGMIQYYSLIR